MAGVAALPEIQLPRLPGEDDLPYSDGIPMEDQFHVFQMTLLIQTLSRHWSDRQDFFVGGNMFVYFSQDRLLKSDFRGPDVFVALDVPHRLRKSWVVWQEGKGPDVVIEILSASTAEVDRTTKKRVYQDELRVPEYFWFDPETGKPSGFALREGVYEPIAPDEQGRLPSRRLGLLLRTWRGSYEGYEAVWLRWCTPDGTLLATPQEAAAQERERAERLAERLRALGVDPDDLGS